MCKVSMVNTEVANLVTNCLESIYKNMSDVISERERDRLVGYYSSRIIAIMLSVPEKDADKILLDSAECGYEKFTRDINNYANQFAPNSLILAYSKFKCDIYIFFNKKRISKALCKPILKEYNARKLKSKMQETVNSKLSFLG